MDLQNFISENKKVGGLSVEISDDINTLWNDYKLTEITEKCSIISADFGNLGSINIKEILEYEKNTFLKYESGRYDFISIKTKSEQNILWTDYLDIQPYNRQSGLYANGLSFKSLGLPILEKPDYREFFHKNEIPCNVSFGVWGFRYTFYKTVTFGICLKTENVKVFLEKLRLLIDK